MNELIEMVKQLIPESNRKCKEKACLSLSPLHFLHDMFVRKVKILSLNWRRFKSFMVKAVVLQKITGAMSGAKV